MAAALSETTPSGYTRRVDLSGDAMAFADVNLLFTCRP